LDQFEAARLKNDKRLERLARSQANQDSGEEEKVVYIEPPKEMAVTAASVEVRVTLPNGSFAFMLFKPDVLHNASAVKLTRPIFMNAVKDGLRPILGETKEV
jgi:hypothetical protein